MEKLIRTENHKWIEKGIFNHYKEYYRLKRFKDINIKI
jgi:hypothetical protein